MASLASESRSAEVDAAGVLAAILDYVTINSNQWNMEKSPNISPASGKTSSAVQWRLLLDSCSHAFQLCDLH